MHLLVYFRFLIILGTSFTSEEVIRTEGAQLFPKQFTTKAYEMVLQGGAIWKSYGLTITMTLTGTLVGLGIISMTGYALQRKDFPFRMQSHLHLFYHTVLSRSGSVLPVNDTNLQAAG